MFLGYVVCLFFFQIVANLKEKKKNPVYLLNKIYL